ncbi:MAG: aspartyl protease family protein [Candidatus Eremiobacteraeota bacterium]|nr:aspartyl protease family protein [Candidatus Eremiobacteraeota bacterium]MBV8355284.1 aspartyl protease family protein [Candidatus Eremiobacteraeota bacterium]
MRVSASAALAVAWLLWLGAAPPLRAPALETVLQRYAAATDRPGAIAITTLEISGQVAGSGLLGTFHTWREGDRERDDNALGARHERLFSSDGRLTIEDENGDVRELRGLLARRERTQRFIDSGDFITHPESVNYFGIVQVDGRPAYGLEVTAPHGEPMKLYLDTTSALPLRQEYVEGDGPMWFDFSDWREIDGHLFPWRAVLSDGDHAFDVMQFTSNVTINGKIADATFVVPTPHYLALSAPVIVPITESGSHLYCDVGIGGKHYHFLIDSGSTGIVVDLRVAREQGLSVEGALELRGATRTGGLQLVTLPTMHIGAASLDDIVAASLDLGASSHGTLRVDGILGYPLFARALVKLDLDNNTMTLAAPGTLAPHGTRLELELDRGLPETSIGVNGMYRAPFLIDTGNSAELLLFKWFVEQYPSLGVGPTGPSGRSFGLGGSTSSHRTIVDEIDLGGTKLYQRDAHVMMATRGAFADRYDAGNVGLGVLHNFIMTFDEPDYALFLEPSASFADGHDRPLSRGNMSFMPRYPMAR